MSEADDDLKSKLKVLRREQLERLAPVARQAAEAPQDHEQLAELIKVYTAIKAVEFAIKHYDEED